MEEENIDYKNFNNRIRSFANWPYPSISGRKMAEAGFYYTDYEDVVRCPYCFIEGYRWKDEDNPREDHATWSPNCPFIRGLPEATVNQDIPPDRPSVVVERLPQETVQLESNRLCKICYGNDIEIVLIPCGHLVLCRECALHIETCPLCRQTVCGKMRAYLP